MTDTSSGSEPTPGDTMRNYTAILENQVAEGIRTIERPATGQFVSRCPVASTSDSGRCS